MSFFAVPFSLEKVRFLYFVLLTIVRKFHKKGDSVKNHIDMLIFHTAICDETSQISHDATTEIAYATFWCAIPRTKNVLGKE